MRTNTHESSYERIYAIAGPLRGGVLLLLLLNTAGLLSAGASPRRDRDNLCTAMLT